MDQLKQFVFLDEKDSLTVWLLNGILIIWPAQVLPESKSFYTLDASAHDEHVRCDHLQT